MSKFSRPDRSHFFPYRRGETYPQQMTMNFRKLNVGAATIAILLRMTARLYHVFRVCMYFCERVALNCDRWMRAANISDTTISTRDPIVLQMNSASLWQGMRYLQCAVWYMPLVFYVFR